MDVRRVESEYQFDRLADVQLVQVYDRLVPQRSKVLEKGKEHVDSSVLEEASSDAHARDVSQTRCYERGA